MKQGIRTAVGIGVVGLVACSQAVGPAHDARPSPTMPRPEGSKMSESQRTGVLIVYKNGRPIGAERYRDDGRELVSEIDLAGHKAVVTLSRSPRIARVEAGGKSDEHVVG